MKPNLSYASLIASALLTSSLAVAYDGGDKTGGGGDRIQCLENGKLKNYMLDLFEAKERGLLPQLGDVNLSVAEKIDRAEAFLSDLDPARAKEYADNARQILEDIRALEGGAKKGPHGLVSFSEYELDDIDDADEEFDFGASNEKPTPTRCIKSQLVRQDFGPSAIAPYRIFRKDYQSLDNNQKTAMLFHEVIYKEFRQYGALVSKTARAFTRMILTGQVYTTFPSVQEYLEFLKKNRIPSYVHSFGSFSDPTSVSWVALRISQTDVQFKDGQIYSHPMIGSFFNLPGRLSGVSRFRDGKLYGIRTNSCFDLENGQIIPKDVGPSEIGKAPILNRYCKGDYEFNQQNGTLTVKATNDLFIAEHYRLLPHDGHWNRAPTHTFVTDLHGKVLSTTTSLDSRPMDCQIQENIGYLDEYIPGGARIRSMVRSGAKALKERGYAVARSQYDANFVVEEFTLPDGSTELRMYDIRRLQVHKAIGKKKRMESRKSFYRDLIRQLPICPNL